MTRILELFDRSPVVDLKSIERIVRVSAGGSNYAKLLVSNLIKQGRIKKLVKGKYTAHDDVSLTVLCFSPAYLGLQSALSFHGLWEQETLPVIVTAEKVRSGRRTVFDGSILIKRADKRFIFGFEYLQDGDFYLPYSDVEKTFVDMVVFKQNISHDVLASFIKKINRKKLIDYLKKYSKRTRDMVMKIYINGPR